MVKIIIKNNIIPKIENNVACIGFFDGVHLGHQKLIKETIKQANKNKIKSALICFDPDPLDIITHKKNKHLMNLKDRLNAFELMGIDIVIIIKFNEEIMNLKPQLFISNYLNKMNINTLICGYDFTYGYKAKGNNEQLNKYGKFKTIVIDKLTYKNEKISSSRIKEALIQGDFKLVNKLLGYDYSIHLKVTNVSKIKDKWLIESILKDKNNLLPQDNIYADNLAIINQKVYISSKDKLDTGTIIQLNISQYE